MIKENMEEQKKIVLTEENIERELRRFIEEKVDPIRHQDNVAISLGMDAYLLLYNHFVTLSRERMEPSMMLVFLGIPIYVSSEPKIRLLGKVQEVAFVGKDYQDYYIEGGL